MAYEVVNGQLQKVRTRRYRSGFRAPGWLPVESWSPEHRREERRSRKAK